MSKKWITVLLMAVLSAAASAQVNYTAYVGAGPGAAAGRGPGLTGSLGVAAFHAKSGTFATLDTAGLVVDPDGAIVTGSARLVAQHMFLNSGEGLGVGGGFTANRRALVAASLISDGLHINLFGILPTDHVRSAGMRAEVALPLQDVPLTLYPYFEITRQDFGRGRETRAAGGVEMRFTLTKPLTGSAGCAHCSTWWRCWR